MAEEPVMAQEKIDKVKNGGPCGSAQFRPTLTKGTECYATYRTQSL